MTDLGIDDPADDPPPPLGPPRPNALQRREALVERGDVAGIYNAILTSPWHETKHSDAFAQVFRAIDVASRRDPVGFSDELLRMMLNMAGYVTLRVQNMLVQRIQDADGHTHDAPPDLLPDVLEKYLGHLVSMQTHVAELCQSRAATARLWQLAWQKKVENDRRESKRRQNGRQGVKAGAPDTNGSANGHQPPNGANGHTHNRLTGLTSGTEPEGQAP